MRFWILWFLFVIIGFNYKKIYKEIKTVIYDISGTSNISKPKIDSLHKHIDSLELYIKGIETKAKKNETHVNN